MFKKIITLLIALSIFSGQAIASTGTGLKTAFDELNYSLTVEWDQKDQTFYDDQMSQFVAKIEELKSQGLTQSDLINFAKSEIKNAKSSFDLDAALEVIQANKLTASETNSYILQALEGSHSTGANWVNNNNVEFWGLILGIAVFVYIAVNTDDL